jgi:hypothetical protein
MERIARSLNVSLLDGASDGVVKKDAPDRESTEATTAVTRSTLFNGIQGYGFADGESVARRAIAGTVRGT